MNTQWIPALTALVAVIVSPIVSVYVVRKQINANVVSMNRQKWIDNLRDQLSELISLLMFINLGIHSKLVGKDNLINKIEKAFFVETKIKLLINPREEDHIELISLIHNAVEEIFKDEKDRNLGKLMECQKAIVRVSQEVLKRESERVKKGE